MRPYFKEQIQSISHCKWVEHTKFENFVGLGGFQFLPKNQFYETLTNELIIEINKEICQQIHEVHHVAFVE